MGRPVLYIGNKQLSSWSLRPWLALRKAGIAFDETIIPRNTRVAEAPSHGKPILLYDFDCAGSQAYIKLATEIIERERERKAA